MHGCTAGDFEGSVDLQWEADKAAVYFLIQATATPDNPASWVLIGTSSRSSYSAANLPSGSMQYFRVAAAGRAGQGPWSEIDNKRVA